MRPRLDCPWAGTLAQVCEADTSCAERRQGRGNTDKGPCLVRYNQHHMEGLDRKKTALYSAGSIGAGAFYAFNNFVLPPILKGAGAPDLLTGLLSSTRSIEGVVIQPTVGAVSDRIWTPHLGRRRIFIAIGIPLSAFFFVIAGFFTHTLLGLAIAIFLFSIFFNAAVDPYAALLADIAPVHQRGLLSGVSTAVQLLAQVAFLVVVSRAAASGEVPLWTYALVGVVMVARSEERRVGKECRSRW